MIKIEEYIRDILKSTGNSFLHSFCYGSVQDEIQWQNGGIQRSYNTIFIFSLLDDERTGDTEHFRAERDYAVLYWYGEWNTYPKAYKKLMHFEK